MWGVKEIEKVVKGKFKVFNVRICTDEVVIYKEVEVLSGEFIKCYYKYYDYLFFTVVLLGICY